MTASKSAPHWFTEKSVRKIALSDFVARAEQAHEYVELRMHSSLYGPELLLFVSVPRYDLREHRVGLLGTYGGKVRATEAEKILAGIRASLDIEGIMKPKTADEVEAAKAALAAPTA
ncbi:hypothetical protein [Bradyrhizobium sp. CCBAU 45384]|uniref:hypothetical protein n=1 Tax=Bradyrhizobium sp. CCBAU 45384 TaxID=858428 RepID=UPI002305738E|nr:hypothetical protein [Bradyrhizobium sp. CCBAU 45384]MDA9411891.1 hypothetical protein [Bradyrhizobium sp. CCBAU 45384]